MTTPSDLLLVGRIYRPHGIGGAFKVIPESDDPQRLTSLETVYVGADVRSARPVTVLSCKIMPTKQGPTLLVEAEGVSTPEGAEALRGKKVYAAQTDLPLAPGEYFLHDLIGIAVMGEDGELLGQVREVRDGPMYNLFEIERVDGKTAFVPDVPAFVLDLDLEARRLVIRPIEGLLED